MREQCVECKRLVEVNDGRLVTHGPGPRDEFVCPGSGNKEMVKAAVRLNIVSDLNEDE